MNFKIIREKLVEYRKNGADLKLMDIVDTALDFVDNNLLLEDEAAEKEDGYHNQRMIELSSKTQSAIYRLEKAFEAIEND